MSEVMNETRMPTRTLPALSLKKHGRIVVAVAMAAIATVLIYHYADLNEVENWLQDQPAWIVIAAAMLLPVFGFSVAIVYLVTGARFGGPLGMCLIAVAIAFHLAASYWISQSWLRDRLESMLSKRGHHLPHVPEGEERSLTLLAALVPGLPYAARNYLLALAGVPFPVYMGICFPIYFLRSLVAIYLGAFSFTLSWQKLGILGGILAIKIGICIAVLFRVRRHLAMRSSGDTRKEPSEA